MVRHRHRPSSLGHARSGSGLTHGAAALWLGLCGVMLLTACAGGGKPPDDTELRLQAASHAFGGRFGYFIVQPSATLADQALVGVSGVIGRSALAENLAARIAPATASEVRLLVTGARTDKTLQVIEQAFALTSSASLPGLELLYLGVPRHEARVRKLVEARGARFRFAAFEE